MRACPSAPIPEELQRRYFDRVEQQIDRPLPQAALGRGIPPAYWGALFLIEDGLDVLLPILDPQGRIVAVKRRRVNASSGRYRYLVGGKGNPAWCSPCFDIPDEVLIMEGELNGMLAWLARPDLAVMGVAGTSGSLWLEALQERRVYVYADPDPAGMQALVRWAKAARAMGCRTYTLEGWDDGDACDVAAAGGLEELRRRLS